MVQDAYLTSPFEYHFHPCPPTDYSYLLSALRAATECQWGAEAQLSSLSRRRFGRSILVVFSCFFPSPPSHISKFSASRAIFHTQLLEGDLIQSDDHAFMVMIYTIVITIYTMVISTPFPFGCLDRCGPFMIPSCQNPAFVFIGILILSVLVKKEEKKKKVTAFLSMTSVHLFAFSLPQISPFPISPILTCPTMTVSFVASLRSSSMDHS